MEFVLQCLQENSSRVSRCEFSTCLLICAQVTAGEHMDTSHLTHTERRCVRVQERCNRKDSRAQAHAHACGATLEMTCIMLAVTSVMPAQIGTDESPTGQITADVLRGPRYFGKSPLFVVFLVKVSLTVTSDSNGRLQRHDSASNQKVQSGQSTRGVRWRSCDIQTLDCESEHQESDSWCDGYDLLHGSGVNVDDLLNNHDMETSDSKKNTPNPMRTFSALLDQIVDVPLHKSRQSGRSSCSQRSGH